MREFIPLCMTTEEHELWKDANRAISAKHHRAERPCSDCPIAFAHQMRLEMRCNGATRIDKPPKTPQRRLLQWREAQVRKRRGIRIRRTPTEVAMLVEQVHEMALKGSATRAIAERLGIEVTYVRDLRRRAA